MCSGRANKGGLTLKPPSPIGFATGHVCQNYGDWRFRRFGAAEQDCTKAILLGTKDAKAWFRRGCARESLKRHNEALGDFEEVLKIDSRNKAALNKLESIRNVGAYFCFSHNFLCLLNLQSLCIRVRASKCAIYLNMLLFCSVVWYFKLYFFPPDFIYIITFSDILYSCVCVRYLFEHAVD